MKCPKCGKEGTLRYDCGYQYIKEFKVLKDGSISKRYKTIEMGSDDWAEITCTNCSLYLNSQEKEFDIQDDKIILEDKNDGS